MKNLSTWEKEYRKLLDITDSHKKEILIYLLKNPPKKCTQSQMCKKGGLRNRQTNPAFLKKKLNELDKEGVIIKNEVKDEVVPGRGYTYYLANVGAKKCGEPGVASFLEEKMGDIINLLSVYYSRLTRNILELHLCRLCKKWTKSLLEKNILTDENLGGKDEMGCGNFLSLWQALEEGKGEDELTIYAGEEINVGDFASDLKRIKDEFFEKGGGRQGVILFLEDLAIQLLNRALYVGGPPACKNCDVQKKCLDEGHKWTKGFLEKALQVAPSDKGITKFWKGIYKREKKFHSEDLYLYFNKRYGSPKKPLEGEKLAAWINIFEQYYSYFYSKLIPRAVFLLLSSNAVRTKEQMKFFEKFEQEANEWRDKEVALGLLPEKEKRK